MLHLFREYQSYIFNGLINKNFKFIFISFKTELIISSTNYSSYVSSYLRYHLVAYFINMAVILDYSIYLKFNIHLLPNIQQFHSPISLFSYFSLHEVPDPYYSRLLFSRSLNNKFRLETSLFRLSFVYDLLSYSAKFH